MLSKKFTITCYQKIQMIFQEIGGEWLAVDSAERKPPTLAEILSKENIKIDDDCQFCRIIRQNDKVRKYIEYRAYGGRIRLNITQIKEE